MVQRRPAVNADRESNIRGLYIIGDLAGAPVIKLAMAQGYEIIEHIASKPDAVSDDPNMYDVLIVGAGAAGNECRPRGSGEGHAARRPREGEDRQYDRGLSRRQVGLRRAGRGSFQGQALARRRPQGRPRQALERYQGRKQPRYPHRRRVEIARAPEGRQLHRAHGQGQIPHPTNHPGDGASAATRAS